MAVHGTVVGRQLTKFRSPEEKFHFPTEKFRLFIVRFRTDIQYGTG